MPEEKRTQYLTAWGTLAWRYPGPAYYVQRGKAQEQAILAAQGFALLHVHSTGWLPERDRIAAMLGTN